MAHVGVPYWRLSAWYFFYFAFIGAFSPYFGLYLQSLKFSAWDISVLLSLMQVMRLLAPNLWSALAVHVGGKTTLLRATAAMSVAGFAGFFFASSFAALFAAMALLAFFSSASLPLTETLTLEHLRHRTEHYGRLRLWGSIGFIGAVMAVGWLLDTLPLAILLWVSMFLLVGTLACAFVLPESPRAQTDAPHPPLGAALSRPQVLAFFAACFLMSAAHGPLYVFYSIHLVDHGYDKTMVGALWSLGVVAEIVVFLFMPGLLRRYSLRAILMFSLACAVGRFLMIGWGVGSLALLLFAQVLHGATFGACHAAAMAALHRWFPGAQLARAQALYGSVSFGAGGMLGGLLSGQSWEAFGPGWSFTLGALFALAGLLLLWRFMDREAPLDAEESRP